MTLELAGIVIAPIVAVLVGWLLPWLAAKGLVPALEEGGRTVENYRGRDVVLGLGLVWLVWAVGLALLGSILDLALMIPVAQRAGSAWALVGPTLITTRGIAAIPVALVLGALAFGLADDMLGDPGTRGFRGHIRALREGRLTTGALKLLGIGALSLAAGLPIALRLPGAPSSGSSLSDSGQVAWILCAWALAAAVIALSANLINLTDLRPGRALKAYTVLAVLGLVAACAHALFTGGPAIGAAAAAGGVTLPVSATGEAALGTLVLGILLLGPVVAAWRLDLGERAMLGDAGANAMGVVAGYVIAANVSLLGLAVAAAILLVLNLASERVSFSKVIESKAPLRWIDGLGRLEEDTPGSGKDGGRGRT